MSLIIVLVEHRVTLMLFILRFKKNSVNAQCLRTKLSTGDATCLGVCMNVGDHCALVWAGGIETMRV